MPDPLQHDTKLEQPAPSTLELAQQSYSNVNWQTMAAEGAKCSHVTLNTEDVRRVLRMSVNNEEVRAIAWQLGLAVGLRDPLMGSSNG